MKPCHRRRVEIKESLSYYLDNDKSTVRDINDKSSSAFLSRLLDGKRIDVATVQEMYDSKESAHNLKTSNEQLADDLLL